MYSILIGLIIGIFVALLFVNIYFRVKVLKYYRILTKNKIEFPAKYILNKQKLEEEVLPKYPRFKNEINAFCQGIRFSVKVASILLFFITLLAAIMYYFEIRN